MEAPGLPLLSVHASLVLEVPHAPALVVIAYPALKGCEAAARRIGEQRAQRPGVDGSAYELEWHAHREAPRALSRPPLAE